jgi:hypothetical protein
VILLNQFTYKHVKKTVSSSVVQENKAAKIFIALGIIGNLLAG